MEHATPLKLFHAVRYGVDGTAMPSYAALSEEDLWALAYFVRSLGHAPEDAVSGIQ
jgi:high-affinity iron transporter